MTQNPGHIAGEEVRRNFGKLSQMEQAVIRAFEQRHRITRDVNAEFDSSLTLGQRAADRIAAFGGSWVFIGLFCAVLVTWVVLNGAILRRIGTPIDPYPFILLNLVLSMIAAIQAPIILMSQNRMAAKDRLDAAHDYEVNLKAELEIMALHEKLDALRDAQWAQLLEVQKQQLDILADIASRVQGIPPGADPSARPL